MVDCRTVTAYFALLCIPLLSATNAVLSRAAFSDGDAGEAAIRPLVLATCRTYIAALIFAVVRGVRDYRRHAASGAVVVSGVLTPGAATAGDHHELLDLLKAWGLGALTYVNVLTFVVGVSLTDGITVAGLLSLIPSLTFLCGWALDLEPFSTPKAAASILSIVGNLIMVHAWRIFTASATDDTRIASSYYAGIALLLPSCLMAALYALWQKPVAARMSYIDFLFHMYAASAACALFSSLVPRENIVSSQLIGGMSTLSWLSILYAGVMQSSLNFYLIVYAIDHIGSAVVVSLFRSSAPLFVVIESVVFLRESMDQWQMVGGALVVVSVALALTPLVRAEIASRGTHASSTGAANSIDKLQVTNATASSGCEFADRTSSGMDGQPHGGASVQ